jgi:hypothetical protein
LTAKALILCGEVLYACRMKNKSNTSVRLTPEATVLLKELATKLGVSQTAIIEMSIRKLAKFEVSLPSPPRKETSNLELKLKN